MLVERQPAEHHRVDDGEDGGPGADAEGEHGQRDDREGPGVAQGAERGSQIVSHGRLDVAAPGGVGSGPVPARPPFIPQSLTVTLSGPTLAGCD